jgi:hypothetical protein
MPQQMLMSRPAWAWAAGAVLAVGLAALALWCLAGGAEKVPLDDRTRAILAGATRVEVFRLDPSGLARGREARSEGERRFAGYLVTAQGEDQGRGFARRLWGVLSDGRTYTDGFVHCFEPGVGFRVWKGEEAVDVLLCFVCKNFYCGPPKDHPRENGSFNGSPRRADLVRLAQEAFPDDKEIQGLKAQ